MQAEIKLIIWWQTIKQLLSYSCSPSIVEISSLASVFPLKISLVSLSGSIKHFLSVCGNTNDEETKAEWLNRSLAHHYSVPFPPTAIIFSVKGNPRSESDEDVDSEMAQSAVWKTECCILCKLTLLCNYAIESQLKTMCSTCISLLFSLSNSVFTFPMAWELCSSYHVLIRNCFVRFEVWFSKAVLEREHFM